MMNISKSIKLDSKVLIEESENYHRFRQNDI